MKIEQFNITPIYREETVVGFEISVDNCRIIESGCTIRDGRFVIQNITVISE